MRPDPSPLPATHLLRQFVLFALLVVFLLLLLRAGYALWQFPAVEAADTSGRLFLSRLFLTGLRFDLALVGTVCLLPIVFGSVFAMFDVTRALAKVLVSLFLVGGLVLVLVTELLTPYFIDSAGVRPDASSFGDPARLAGALIPFATEHPLPSAFGVLLAAALLFAYIARMQSEQLLRTRLSRPSALVLALLGGVVCLIAARSALHPAAAPLSAEDARLGGAPVLDELAMNSAWTTLRSLAVPPR